MATVHDVAAYILERKGPMSSMKLQKLVYYSQAWHLVWADEPLFNEQIQAWANGPVVYELFAAHRGRYTVDAPWPQGDANALNRIETGSIDAVLKTYGDLSGRQLSVLTHDEGPWRETRGGLPATASSSKVIELTTMAQYYGALENDEKATPVDEIDWGGWDLAEAP